LQEERGRKENKMVYKLERTVYKERFWNSLTGKDVEIHIAYYKLSMEEYSSEELNLERVTQYNFELPCRANLNKLITILFLNGNFKDDHLQVNIDEKTFNIIKTVLEHKKEYSFWRKTLKVLKKDGAEKAKEYLESQIPFIILKVKLT